MQGVPPGPGWAIPPFYRRRTGVRKWDPHLTSHEVPPRTTTINAVVQIGGLPSGERPGRKPVLPLPDPTSSDPKPAGRGHRDRVAASTRVAAPVTSRAIRRVILDQAYRAGVGHIGSALAVADLLRTLYGKVLHVPDPSDPDRDRFVLGKGHAALALYAALNLTGRLTSAELDSYCGDESRLGVHPQHSLPYVDFTTGSLGMSLSFAAGCALAARIQGSGRRVVVLLSDAECDEGAVWEAAMFAAHHKLSNLIVVVDLDGQQALGRTSDVLDLEPMADRWQAFRWDTHDIDGHNETSLLRSIRACDRRPDHPHAILARTTFGSGVPFMERQIKWHYSPMSEAEYLAAVQAIEALP